MINSLNCKTIIAFTGVDFMLFFNKKVNPSTINEIEEILNKYNEEFEDCYLPNGTKFLCYLGGHKTLDSLCENELTNFDLHKLFDYKKITLANCLDEQPKVRKSFFYSLNNIKQSQDFEDTSSLLDFLENKGKMFINDYLKTFQKSAEYYNKKHNKGKLPEYRELYTWTDDEYIYLLDKLFVYLGAFKIKLDSIIDVYENDDIARTVLKYRENDEVNELYFNLEAYGMLKNFIPYKND